MRCQHDFLCKDKYWLQTGDLVGKFRDICGCGQASLDMPKVGKITIFGNISFGSWAIVFIFLAIVFNCIHFVVRCPLKVMIDYDIFDGRG